MPAYSLSTKFERQFAKLKRKDAEAEEQINDAFEKFAQNPVPHSLHFQEVPGSKGRYYIRIPMRKGWRIYFRKLQLNVGVVYEAIEMGNHDSKRAGH